MKTFATFVIVLLLVALLGVFVWGWFSVDRRIPEIVFGGILSLIATIVGYIWLREPRE